MAIVLSRRGGLAALIGTMLALALPASASATFAGANGKIFFEGPASGTTDIFSIDPLGGEADNLTETSTPNEQRPAASADGRVVFQAFGEGGWNIFKMNADGSGVVNLTKTLHPIVNFEPTWSPDGSEVVYMRQDESGQDLWRVGADGSNPENLTETAGVEESGAEFSADGTKIAYVGTGPKPCCDPEYNNDIWVMDPDGTDQEQLTKTNYPQQNLSPTWSPDGAKIAYSVVPSEGGTDAGFHVMDADGTDQVRPLSGAEPIFSLNLSWSPDGTKIVYQRMSGGLKVMNPDASENVSLVGDTGAAYPSWAPAGSSEEEEEEEEGGGEEGGSTPTTPSPTPSPTSLLTTPAPSNAIVIGKVKLNKAKGTATLTINVPGPGKLALGGKGVQAATKSVAAAGKAMLAVKASGKALAKLNDKGAVALKAKVTFTPAGGTPGTATKSLTLKKQL